MSTVNFEKIVKSYGDTSVVRELDLELPDGSFTVLVGPSGCGKTTTLRMLAGLETVTSGRILIGGRDVTKLEPKDRDIAMVFQNYALYPHLSVRENLAFPLRAIQTPKDQVATRVDSVAGPLGLTPLLHRKPKDLSGGQQQRVAIGRAIIRQPSVFLFDEPLSNLDAKLRVEMRTELLQIQRRLGTTALYVTHDQEEAMTLSDCIVVMRDGQIAQQGKPQDVYDHPNSTFVAAFVGSPKMNLMDGTVTDGVFVDDAGFSIGVTNVAAGRFTLGVRPDDILIGLDESSPHRGVVDVVELLGPRAIVSVISHGQNVAAVVEAASMTGIREGATVSLGIRPGSQHLFNQSTGLRVGS
ncbi:ABC transporter ATP-binding protein [Lacisediminihabitans profunda]|uniref:sn-glycerol-3-phosphate ABC transporter ATP-binding protein UgpC n=1 Tax=Lacisediminihabitans profunda TaxID=2594790 RepID=A0A5C8URP4_9MICO|nr:sn-glycerol-3-phosphate ABC transporter ATP-binding protein UgpC [Lacisediminihabitans profunda]TXN31244.1 sn-glycerol-3-phosphate ABC transporter ATP-binding protein UgpC [Lacisediminihabitans profunda]